MNLDEIIESIIIEFEIVLTKYGYNCDEDNLILESLKAMRNPRIMVEMLGGIITDVDEVYFAEIPFKEEEE